MGTVLLVVGIVAVGLVAVSVFTGRRAARRDLAIAQADVARLRAQKEARGSPFNFGTAIAWMAGIASAVVGVFNPAAGAAVAAGGAALAEAAS